MLLAYPAHLHGIASLPKILPTLLLKQQSRAIHSAFAERLHGHTYMVTYITKYCQRICIDQHWGFLVTKMKNTGGKPVKFLETTTCNQLEIFLKIYLCSNYVMYLRKENQETKRKKKIRNECINGNMYCAKNVQIRSFFWSVFFHIWTEYGKIWTRKNSVFGQNDALMKNFGYFENLHIK